MESKNISDIFCYSWAGLNLRFISPPEILTGPVNKMFILNRIPETDRGIDIKMTLEKGNAFISAMPEWVQHIYLKMDPGEDPYIEYNKEYGFVVILKGAELSAFAVSLAPYTDLLVVTEVPEETGKSPLLFNTVLIPALRELLLIQGKALLHAGCVVSPAGDAILIIADSGGGKTSTTISLTREGFHFISDDLVTLSVSERGIIVEGIAKQVNLTQKTIEFFPELDFIKLKKERSGDYKTPVDPIQIFQKDGMAGQGIVKALLIPRITKKGPSLNRLELHESLPVLMKGHTFAHEAKKNDKSMEILWGLIEKCSIYRLNTGNDPVKLGEWLASQAAKGRFAFSFTATKKKHNQKPGHPSSNSASAKMDSMDTVQWFHHMLDFSLGSSETEESMPAVNMDTPAVFHRIWELVTYHRLEPFAAKWMAESRAGQSIPLWVDAEKIMSDAKNRYVKLCKETVYVHCLLTEQQHDFLFLRGPGFASNYYPHPWQRHSRDIDIVCHTQSIPEIESLLTANGYKPIPFGTRDYWMGKGELPFQKNGITVEIHWDAYPMLPGNQASLFRFKNCLDSAVKISLQGTEINCLNVNHLFLSSCLHAIWEHHFDRMLRMVDIRQILEKDSEKIDWEWIQKHARPGKHEAVLAHFLFCVQKTVQGKVPEQGLKLIEPFFFKKYLSRLVLPWSCILKDSRPSRFRRRLYTRTIQLC